MNVTDWIISISAAGIGILISITAYFAQKWIGSVDETIKEHSKDLKAISSQISTLKSLQAITSENISKTIETKLAAIKFPHSKIDEIGREVDFIKATLQEKILPQQDRSQESFGRIKVLEDSMRDQQTKMTTMFNALKLLVEQKQKGQK